MVRCRPDMGAIGEGHAKHRHLRSRLARVAHRTNNQFAIFDREYIHIVADSNEIGHTHTSSPVSDRNPCIAGNARIRAKLCSMTPCRLELVGCVAIEDSRLTTPRLHHLEELADKLRLHQPGIRPDGRVVRIPALAILPLKVATLAQTHLIIVVVEE